MIFRGKKLSDIQVEDLQRLIDEKVQERDTVEYKRDMYGTTDADKREMLRDITSMANHRGGYLLIGIDEDDEGIPANIIGTESGNHVERIRSCCLDNIEKRIIGLDIRDMPLGNGKVVVIVSIPESINAPHMIIQSGLNQFWKRHGRQKDKMTIDEVGEAFDRRLSNLNRLDRFLFIRKAEILEDIGEQTLMIISASPAYLRDEIVLSNQDEKIRTMIRNPTRYQNQNDGIYSGTPYPTINGLRADNRIPFHSDNKTVNQYIEVFFNGYIEFGFLMTPFSQHGTYFASLVETPYIVDFLGFTQNIFEQFFPFLPIIVSFSIFNAKGIWLATSNSGEDAKVKWQRQHLELGNFFIDNISNERKLVTKRICDRIWQCFNREKCNLFDNDGTFCVPR
jgi:hypothetical protein